MRHFSIRINGGNAFEYYVAKISQETYDFWNKNQSLLAEYMNSNDNDRFLSDNAIPEGCIFAGVNKSGKKNRHTLNFASNFVMFIGDGFEIIISEISENGEVIGTIFSGSDTEFTEKYGEDVHDCILPGDELADDPTGPGFYVECTQHMRGYLLGQISMEDEFNPKYLRINRTLDLLFADFSVHPKDCLYYLNPEPLKIESDFEWIKFGQFHDPVLQSSSQEFSWHAGKLNNLNT